MRQNTTTTTDNNVIHPDWIKLSEAIAEILNNPATPAALFNPVIEFLQDEATGMFSRFLRDPEMIQRILVEASVDASLNEEVAHASN